MGLIQNTIDCEGTIAVESKRKTPAGLSAGVCVGVVMGSLRVASNPRQLDSETNYLSSESLLSGDELFLVTLRRISCTSKNESGQPYCGQDCFSAGKISE